MFWSSLQEVQEVQEVREVQKGAPQFERAGFDECLIAVAMAERAIPQAAKALKDLFVNLRIILCRVNELGILIQRKTLIRDSLGECAPRRAGDAIMLSRGSSSYLIAIVLLKPTDAFEGGCPTIELLFRDIR